MTVVRWPGIKQGVSMAIEFSCQCGKQIKVADKFAGRSGKCPACGSVITIPDPGTQDVDTDLLYEALTPDPEPNHAPGAQADGVCSGCGKPMPSESVLCIHCGFNRSSMSYANTANKDDADTKEPGAAMLTVAGVELRWWRVLLVGIPIIAISTWYFTGPARDVLMLNVQTVSVIESIHSGETREPFSLFTQQGDRSLGIKGPQSKSNPSPFISDVDEVYSLGASDELLVVSPDDSGDHIVLEVALKQGTIQDAGRISLYDSIIASKDFKLVPSDGSAPIDAQLLYHQFENGVEVDIGGAQTSSYEAMFPMEPTTLNMDRDFGTINGNARWNEYNAKGDITFTSYYSHGEFQAAKGLHANGKISLTDDTGTTVNMNYAGGTLNVDWGSDAAGWWSKKQYTHMSQPSPWYRYHFGLLFDRPAAGGDYDLTYCDKHVATVSIEPAPPPKMPGLSPIKRAQSKNTTKSTNNPLAYFKVIADARHQARGIASASNLRQLGIGLQMYLDNNSQAWPDRIEQLKGVMSGYDAVMVNPRTGDNPGFIYIRPQSGANAATTPVLYEAFHGKPDPNGAVLYADGHIE
jgi:hypothetical protein